MAAGSPAEIIADFSGVLAAAGLRPRGGVKADGRLHRCASGERENLNGYYVLHLDGAVPAGAYGCWKSGLKETWKANGAALSDFDREELARKVEADRKRREREEAKRHKDVAESAAMLWHSYKLAPADHPYLVRKQVQPHGACIDGHGNLVVTLNDVDGNIWSLETISPDGQKRFMSGGRKRGCFYAIGELGDQIIVAEGFATAATIHEATGICTVVAFDAGNLEPVARALRERRPDVRIVIAADDDRDTHEPLDNPGVTYAGRAAGAVGGILVVPAFADTAAGTDFNDLAQAEGLGRVAEQIMPAFEVEDDSVTDEPVDSIHASPSRKPRWWDDLLLNREGEPRDCIANIALVLRSDQDFVDKVRFDQLLNAAVCCDMPWRPGQDWRPWTDGDDIALTERLQLLGLPVKKGTVADAVALVAGESPFHPVGAYLDSLTWDGTRRLDTWLSTYLGVADTPYSRAVGEATLVAAVARIRHPGCKADHVPILEGPQGAGKSQAIAALVPRKEWFTDEIADLGTKDAAQALCGKWIIELPELSAMRRGEVETIKAFVARSVDHYRPSYGRRAEDYPRQCVFFGSTNADAYLNDDTGNRRFWPLGIRTIILDNLQRDRDQLWAEASVEFSKGKQWWLNAETEFLAKAEQADRQSEDPWTGYVLEWGDRNSVFVIEDFLTETRLNGGLAIEAEHIGDREFKRVAGILRRAGWVRGAQKRINGARRRPYLRPSPLSLVGKDTGDATGDTNNAENINRHSSPVTPVTREMGSRTYREIGANGHNSPIRNTPRTPLETYRNQGDASDRGDTLLEELVP
ncbi:MAG TPA: VapE family protein [Geminicoccaceae bacterium]|nr:VapE family protein [Geminicoccaceae bacterium]